MIIEHGGMVDEPGCVALRGKRMPLSLGLKAEICFMLRLQLRGQRLVFPAEYANRFLHDEQKHLSAH